MKQRWASRRGAVIWLRGGPSSAPYTSTSSLGVSSCSSTYTLLLLRALVGDVAAACRWSSVHTSSTTVTSSTSSFQSSPSSTTTPVDLRVRPLCTLTLAHLQAATVPGRDTIFRHATTQSATTMAASSAQRFPSSGGDQPPRKTDHRFVSWPGLTPVAVARTILAIPEASRGTFHVVHRPIGGLPVNLFADIDYPLLPRKNGSNAVSVSGEGDEEDAGDLAKSDEEEDDGGDNTPLRSAEAATLPHDDNAVGSVERLRDRTVADFLSAVHRLLGEERSSLADVVGREGADGLSSSPSSSSGGDSAWAATAEGVLAASLQDLRRCFGNRLVVLVPADPNPTKVSVHLHLELCGGVVAFRDTETVGRVIDAMSFTDEATNRAIDRAVYRRSGSLRMMGSTRDNGTGRLVLCPRWSTVDDAVTAAAMSLCVAIRPPSVVVASLSTAEKRRGVAAYPSKVGSGQEGGDAVDASPERIAALLDAIDHAHATEFSSWVKVCSYLCSISHWVLGGGGGGPSASSGGRDGGHSNDDPYFDLFVRFSQRAPNFDLRSCTRMWGSMQRRQQSQGGGNAFARGPNLALKCLYSLGKGN